jgi:transcriptional regulator with PAS, ATPase and Fis domain
MLNTTDGLPRDADEVLRLAARSMFDTMAQTAQGVLVVGRDHRIVWISEGYKRFLPALGVAREEDFVGQPVESVVPNTQMGHVIETGQAILADLLTNQAGSFLVSRLPLRDDAGRVLGAVGLIFANHGDGADAAMPPLMAKFSRLHADLEQTRRELAAEQGRQRRVRHTFASFIGHSPPVMEVKRTARRAAGSDASVLLLGETGTGKELLAQAIHAASRRAARPFVGVNIAAVPDTLLEAEFFGVAAGAYTGADRRGRAGKFKLADGGTLFLDEIGDMPLALQAKLLRVLQEQEVEPLGSNTVEPIDVRVIAATSRDLAAMVADGRFRADLYYRLNVLPVRVPPLRERPEDLDALTDHLLDDIARRSGTGHRSLTADALALLGRHAWPGNIRELRNLLEQAALMTDAPQIDVAHLAPLLPGVPAATPAAMAPPAQARHDTTDDTLLALPLPQAVAALEARAIRAAMAATGGNKQAAAKRLGIARATLYEKLAALDATTP